MPITWNELYEGGTITGERVSPLIDISSVKIISSAIISWDVDIPAGTTFTLESNVSLNGGNTWLGWKTPTNGGSIPDLGLGVDASNALVQLKATFSSTDVITTPRLSNVTLSLVPGLTTGYFITPTWDLRDEAFQSSTITWGDVTPAGTSITVEMRSSYDGTNWSEWVAATKNAPFPTSGGLYLQARATLTPDSSRTTSPILTNLSLTAKGIVYRGVWESDKIDISNAKDKSSGQVVVTTNSGAGSVLIQSKVSTNNGVTWSQWYNAAADGTLSHPEGNHIKIRLLFIGESLEIQEVTLVLDGEATASLLLDAGLTESAEYDFTTLSDMVVIVNGKDQPRKWDGTNEVELLGGNPPVFSIVETHLNRVFAVETEVSSRVRFSDILDPEKWEAFNFLDFNPDDGDHITAMIRYGQSLVVSKRRSMALLVGNTTSNFSVTWLETEQGAAGKRAITVADKYLAYVAQDGIRFSDLTQSVVATERLLPDWEKINHRRLNQAAMVYWKNQLLTALPREGSLVNNTVWAYDFLRNSWSIYNGWSVSAWYKFHQYGEDVLLAADSTTGQVYQITTDRYDDTIPVKYRWRSKDFNFGHPERYKLFRNIYLDIEGVAEENELEVDLIVDNVVAGTYRTTIPAGEGIKHVRRILPPLYNAVLGRSLAVELRGRCGVQGISIEYVIRGAVPGGDL